ncbi:MAG: acyltransferase domain-containing protein [Desulfobacteraceae bacterium]|nr:acyltransferase domain-containing protein [Desulfobacteraceae bacterium]
MRGTEAVHRDEASRERGYQIPELVVFNAATAGDLVARIDQWVRDLEATGEESGLLKHLSYHTLLDSDQTPAAAPFRTAITAFGEGELGRKLVYLRKLIVQRPDTSFSFPAAGLFYGLGETRNKLAYLFAGQGSQYLGMGKALADAFPAAQRAWETLGAMRWGDQSIREVVFSSGHATSAEAEAAFLKLSSADWTNAAIGVVAQSILNLLEEMGVAPDAVAAHSFGDVAALRAAGVISGEDMIRIARRRGECALACPQAKRGSILIVQEKSERIQSVLSLHGIENVWMANYNTPGQIALTGVNESIVKTHQIMRKQRIASRLIPISGAAHCPLSYDAGEMFAEFLPEITFAPAQCDVYSYLFGHKVGNHPDIYRKLLHAHVQKPVRFGQQIEQLHRDGARIFLEVGPADLLTHMVSQTLEGKPHAAISTDHRKEGVALFTFVNAVAELFKENRVRRLMPLWEGYQIPRARSQSQSGHAAPISLADGYLKKLELAFAKIEREHLSALAS